MPKFELGETFTITIKDTSSESKIGDDEFEVVVPKFSQLFHDRFYKIFWLNFGLNLKTVEISQFYECCSYSLSRSDKFFSMPKGYKRKSQQVWEKALEAAIYNAIGPETEEMKRIEM